LVKISQDYHKENCTDPSDRIYGKYEIYDPYMGKGDGKRRWEKEMGKEMGKGEEDRV
jgi:hypothetical protein